MGILDSNPADAGTVQTDSASDLGDKSVEELFAMEEEADEANPKPVASEEPDGEEQPEVEESDEQDAEPEGQKDSASVEIDGKRYTLEQVREGFMRQADYTRKTQEIASHRKEMDSAVERLSKQDERARADIGFAHAVLNAILPPEPDANSIASDPVGYMQARAQRENAMAVIRDLQARQSALTQRQQQATSEQSVKAMQAEWQSAIQAMPELATQEGKAKVRDEAIKFGKEWGLEPSEIDGIESAKALRVLRDAIEFRKLKASAPKAVQTVKAAPKIARPGTREQPAATPLARLQKLGSDPKSSVADIFAAMEED